MGGGDAECGRKEGGEYMTTGYFDPVLHFVSSVQGGERSGRWGAGSLGAGVVVHSLGARSPRGQLWP